MRDATAGRMRDRANGDGHAIYIYASTLCALLSCKAATRLQSCRSFVCGTGKFLPLFLEEESHLIIQESSSFRNERDAVSAGIRPGPNPQISLFLFFPTRHPSSRRRGARILGF